MEVNEKDQSTCICKEVDAFPISRYIDNPQCPIHHQDERLQKFLFVSVELRKAKEKVLRENGFNFSTWHKLKTEIEDSFPVHLDYGGFRFVSETRPIRQFR